MKEIVRKKSPDRTYKSVQYLSKEITYLNNQIKRLTEVIFKRKNY